MPLKISAFLVDYSTAIFLREIHVSDFQGQTKCQISWSIRCLIIDWFNNHLLRVCQTRHGSVGEIGTKVEKSNAILYTKSFGKTAEGTQNSEWGDQEELHKVSCAELCFGSTSSGSLLAASCISDSSNWSAPGSILIIYFFPPMSSPPMHLPSPLASNTLFMLMTDKFLYLALTSSLSSRLMYPAACSTCALGV